MVNRLSFAMLAFKEHGTTAALTYCFKKRWPNETGKNRLRFLHRSGERIQFFETLQEGERGIQKISTENPVYCKLLENALLKRSSFEEADWHKETAMPFALKIKTNFRTMYVYLPFSRCKFIKNLMFNAD